MAEPPEPTSPKVFISYAWNNKAIARQLQSDLMRDGVEVFIDYEKISGGDSLPARISAGLEWCNTLVLLWSADAAQSYWVSQEWENALQLQKRIIPCLLDGAKLPALLRRLLYLNFFSYETGYAQLTRALAVKAAESATETTKLKAVADTFLNRLKLRKTSADKTILIPASESKKKSPPSKWLLSKGMNIGLALVVIAAVIIGIRLWNQSSTGDSPFTTPALADSGRVELTSYLTGAIYISGDSLDHVKAGERKSYQLKTGESKIILKGANGIFTQSIAITKAETARVTFVWRFRSEPKKLSSDSVKAMLKHFDFYNAPFSTIKWNGKGIANAFEFQNDGEIIFDRAANLMWQKSGSAKPMTHAETLRYVQDLNNERNAVYMNWRLPTLEEAMSLIEREKHGNLHIDVKFDRIQQAIWTADRSHTSSSVWVANFANGSCYLTRIDSDNFYVRAVRSVP